MTVIQGNPLKEKWRHALIAALFLVLTVFIFGPIQLYLPNSGMFPYMVQEVAVAFLPVALIALIVLTGILVALPHRFDLHRNGVALVVGGSVLLWIQANIILWNYGVLDGREIQWAGQYGRGIIDGLIWILGLGWVGVQSERVYRYAKKISVFFILMQLLYTSFLFVQNPEARNPKNFTLLDETAQYGFSSKSNVIIMIVDGFQSDLFQEITDEEPHYKKAFDGFTYYRNALAGFPLTLPSVPFILTGQRYDNSVPFADFIDRVYFTSSSLPWVLKENGYRVDILMDCGRCYAKDKRLISNLKEGRVPLSTSQAGYLFDLTLFKHMPHFLKRVVYNNQNWRFLRYVHYLKPEARTGTPLLQGQINPVTGTRFSAPALEGLFDVRFAAGMLNGARVETAQNVFKFYHLKGIHAPFRMNERLEYEEMGKNRRNWKRLGKGAIAIVEIFLNELKRLNVYDHSLIVIVGDHGHSAGEFGIHVPPGLGNGPGHSPQGHRGRRVSPGVVESGIPLILVKPFHRTGALTVSDSPVSLSDIPRTVFEAVGITGDFIGEAMDRVAPNEERVRRFSFFTWDAGRSVGPYLPPMKDYTVTGHSWFTESWAPAEPDSGRLNRR
ncbi:MAG: sulfatase-like hydrolase/transferase [Candidatus Omnitrophota bacterium]